MGNQKRFQGQLNGYVIADSVDTYLAERYGGMWSQHHQASVTPPFITLLINDLHHGRGGCSLTALTSVFAWMRDRFGLFNLPESTNDLFEKISLTAAGHGYKSENGRTNPLRIANIIRRIWNVFTYSGHGHSWIMASPRKATRLIDSDLPCLLNIAFGHYKFHTVTVTGYEQWRQKNACRQRQRLLLNIYDGWTKKARYLDVQAMRNPLSGNFTFYSLTAVLPEKR